MSSAKDFASCCRWKRQWRESGSATKYDASVGATVVLRPQFYAFPPSRRLLIRYN